MTNLFKWVMLVFGALFLLVSCEKESNYFSNELLSQSDEPIAMENDDDQTPDDDDVMYSFVYFIDNVEVDEENFLEDKVDNYTFAEDDESSTELDRIINVNSFSTIELLAEADSDMAEDLIKVNKFEMKAQALDENSDNYEEELDILHQNIFGDEEDRVSVTQMYDFCNFGEGNNPFTSMIRSRWNLWSFQNRIEMLRHIGVVANVFLYDRSRFRRRIIRVNMWGFTKTCLPGYARNRANSSLRL